MEPSQEGSELSTKKTFSDEELFGLAPIGPAVPGDGIIRKTDEELFGLKEDPKARTRGPGRLSSTPSSTQDSTLYDSLSKGLVRSWYSPDYNKVLNDMSRGAVEMNELQRKLNLLTSTKPDPNGTEPYQDENGNVVFPPNVDPKYLGEGGVDPRTLFGAKNKEKEAIEKRIQELQSEFAGNRQEFGRLSGIMGVTEGGTKAYNELAAAFENPETSGWGKFSDVAGKAFASGDNFLDGAGNVISGALQFGAQSGWGTAKPMLLQTAGNVVSPGVGSAAAVYSTAHDARAQAEADEIKKYLTSRGVDVTNPIEVQKALLGNLDLAQAWEKAQTSGTWSGIGAGVGFKAGGVLEKAKIFGGKGFTKAAQAASEAADQAEPFWRAAGPKGVSVALAKGAGNVVKHTAQEFAQEGLQETVETGAQEVFKSIGTGEPLPDPGLIAAQGLIGGSMGGAGFGSVMSATGSIARGMNTLNLGGLNSKAHLAQVAQTPEEENLAQIFGNLQMARDQIRAQAAQAQAAAQAASQTPPPAAGAAPAPAPAPTPTPVAPVSAQPATGPTVEEPGIAGEVPPLDQPKPVTPQAPVVEAQPTAQPAAPAPVQTQEAPEPAPTIAQAVSQPEAAKPAGKPKKAPKAAALAPGFEPENVERIVHVAGSKNKFIVYNKNGKNFGTDYEGVSKYLPAFKEEASRQMGAKPKSNPKTKPADDQPTVGQAPATPEPAAQTAVPATSTPVTAVVEPSVPAASEPAKAAEAVNNEVEHLVEVGDTKSAGEVVERVQGTLKKLLDDSVTKSGFNNVEYKAGKRGGEVFVDGVRIGSVNIHGNFRPISEFAERIEDQFISIRNLTPSVIKETIESHIAAHLSSTSKGFTKYIVRIPGDGTFKINSNPVAIRQLMSRIKSGGVSMWKSSKGYKEEAKPEAKPAATKPVAKPAAEQEAKPTPALEPAIEESEDFVGKGRGKGRADKEVTISINGEKIAVRITSNLGESYYRFVYKKAGGSIGFEFTGKKDLFSETGFRSSQGINYEGKMTLDRAVKMAEEIAKSLIDEHQNKLKKSKKGKSKVEGQTQAEMKPEPKVEQPAVAKGITEEQLREVENILSDLGGLELSKADSALLNGGKKSKGIIDRILIALKAGDLEIANEAIGELSDLRESLESRQENTPESLQETDTYYNRDEAIDALQSAQDDLEAMLEEAQSSKKESKNKLSKEDQAVIDDVKFAAENAVDAMEDEADEEVDPDVLESRRRSPGINRNSNVGNSSLLSAYSNWGAALLKEGMSEDEVRETLLAKNKKFILENIDQVMDESKKYSSYTVSVIADQTSKAVSTRLPTQAGEQIEPSNRNLVIGLPQVLSNPALMKKMVARLKKVPGFKYAKSDSDEQVVEKFVSHVEENLLWLHDNSKPSVIKRSRLWYVGANILAQRLAKKHKISHEQAAAVIAVISPKMDWFQNLSLAKRVCDILIEKQSHVIGDKLINALKKREAILRIALKAFRPDIEYPKKKKDKNGKEIEFTDSQLRQIEKVNEIAKKCIDKWNLKGKKISEIKDESLKAIAVRGYDEAFNSTDFELTGPEGNVIGTVNNNDGTPSKISWCSFKVIKKVMSILNDGSLENISVQLGGEHKVRNFYNNIIDPGSKLGEVTIDTHAVAAGLLLPLSADSPAVNDNLGGGGESMATGISGTYPLYAEAYRRAAAKRGLLPREMQSITWEAVKGLYTDKYKSNKSNGKYIESIWKKFTDGSIRRSEVLKRILAATGGIKDPPWVGRGLPGAEGAGTEAQSPELAGPTVGGGAGDTDTGATGRSPRGPEAGPDVQGTDEPGVSRSERRAPGRYPELTPREIAKLEARAAELDRRVRERSRKNEANRDPATRRRGAEQIAQRIVNELRKGGNLSFDQIMALLKPIERIIENGFIDDLAVSLQKEDKGRGALGQYNAYARIITIFANAASSTEVLKRTWIHEFAHHLERFLPEKDIQALRQSLKRARAKFLKGKAVLSKLLGDGDWTKFSININELKAMLKTMESTGQIKSADAEFNELMKWLSYDSTTNNFEFAYTDDTYRFTNTSEWWAENVAIIANSIEDSSVNPHEDISLFRRIKDVLVSLKNALIEAFGGRVVERLWRQFNSGAINPEMIRESMASQGDVKTEGYRKPNKEGNLNQRTEPGMGDSENMPIPGGRREAFFKSKQGQDPVPKQIKWWTDVGHLEERNDDPAKVWLWAMDRAGKVRILNLDDLQNNYGNLFNTHLDWEELINNGHMNGPENLLNGPAHGRVDANGDVVRVSLLGRFKGDVLTRKMIKEQLSAELGFPEKGMRGYDFSEMGALENPEIFNRRTEPGMGPSTPDGDVANHDNAGLARRGFITLKAANTLNEEYLNGAKLKGGFNQFGDIAFTLDDPDMNSIAGVRVTIEDGEATVDRIDVDPSARGLKLSTVLYAEIGERLRRRGITKLDGKVIDQEQRPIKARESAYGKGSTTVTGEDKFTAQQTGGDPETHRWVESEIDPNMPLNQRREPGMGPNDELFSDIKSMPQTSTQESVTAHIDKWAARTLAPGRLLSAGPDVMAAMVWQASKAIAKTGITFAKWSAGILNKFGRGFVGLLKSIWNAAVIVSKNINAFPPYRAFMSVAARAWDNANRFPNSQSLRKMAGFIQTRTGPDAEAAPTDIPSRIITVRTQFANMYSNILVKFALEFSRMNKEERRQWDIDFRNHILGVTTPTDPKMVNAVREYRAMMSAALGYQRSVGTDIGDVGAGYIPRSYDSGAVEERTQEFAEAAAVAYEARNERLRQEALDDLSKVMETKWEQLKKADEKRIADPNNPRKNLNTDEEYQKAAKIWEQEQLDSIALKFDKTPEDFEKMGYAWANAIMNGEVADSKLGEAPSIQAGTDSTDARTFTDEEASILDSFIIKDMDLLTMRYLASMVKRTEISRAFGPDRKGFTQMINQMRQEGVDTETIKEMHMLMNKAVGLGGETSSNYSAKVSDWMNVVIASVYLGKSFAYNLTLEPMAFGIRSNMLNAVAGLALTWKNLIKNIVRPTPSQIKMIEAKYGSLDMFNKQLNELLAEHLGLIHSDIEKQFMNSHWNYLDAEQGSPVAKWLSQRIYRANLMNSSESAKVEASVAVARMTIRDNARWLLKIHPIQKLFGRVGIDASAPHSSESIMNELGIPASDHDSFAKFVMSLDGLDEKSLAKEVLALGRNAAFYRQAIQRLSMGMSVKANPALKIASADTGFGKVIMQLMNYSYAFYSMVVNHMYRSTKAAVSSGNMTKADRARYIAPVAGMLMAAVAAFGVKELNAAIDPSTGTRKRAASSQASKVFEAATFAGVLPPPMEMIAKSIQQGRPPGGPMIEAPTRIGTKVYNATAGKGTEAMTRGAVEQGVELGLKPAIIAGSSAVHPSLGFFANILTQNEKFTNTIANKVTGKEKPIK